MRGLILKALILIGAYVALLIVLVAGAATLILAANILKMLLG